MTKNAEILSARPRGLCTRYEYVSCVLGPANSEWMVRTLYENGTSLGRKWR